MMFIQYVPPFVDGVEPIKKKFKTRWGLEREVDFIKECLDSGEWVLMLSGPRLIQVHKEDRRHYVLGFIVATDKELKDLKYPKWSVKV
jgi:hypothetical protein